jgi:hypothetical protein
MWLRNWKCVYEPSAAVQHFTQDVIPGKRRTLENYWSFRNSLFLYYRYGAKNDRSVLWRFLGRRLFSGAYSLRSKALFAIALIDYIRYIPHLIQSGKEWGRGHPRIRLSETSLFQ